MSEVAIIDYGAGNVRNVSFALERLGRQPVLTRDPGVIRSAGHVIFPGVGHARHAMLALEEYGLIETIRELTQPVLGICLGMQVMCNGSEEGDVECLGVFDVDVKRFNGVEKVPHMGWNTVNSLLKSENGTPQAASWYYFVHSYYVPLCEDTWLVSDYGNEFSAGLRKDNFWAVQFHPEKSGVSGERLLKDWLEEGSQSE